MLFQMNENILRKRLKIYMPISFLILAVISISLYSFMLNFIYIQRSPLKRYMYFIMGATAFAIAASIFFDCWKVEKGKFVPLGIWYVFKTGFAFIIVSLTVYPFYIIEGSVTLFELVNIRLIMVLFFMQFSMALAALFFTFLVRRIYIATGRREYYLPMLYSIIPISMASVIFIITIINGFHYRNALNYYGQYNVIVDREYVSDAATSIYDGINEYLGIAKDLAYYLSDISKFGHTFSDYADFLSDYLYERYGNNNNINAFYVSFTDMRNGFMDIRELNYTNISRLNLVLNRNMNYTLRANTNENLSIPTVDLRGTNYSINIVRNSDYFYIYNPIFYNGNEIGFIALEVNSYVYSQLLNRYLDIDMFIADGDFNINAYNKVDFLGEIQSVLNNPATSSELKDENNNNYLNTISDSKVILNEEYNHYFVKYLIFDDIYIIGSWENIIPYKTNITFRRTILISSITIYFGLAFFMVILLFVIFSLRKTIVTAKNVSDSLSEGSGDLTIRLPITTIGETGELVHSFNKFLDKVQSIIINIKENTYVLTGSVQNIRSSLNIGVSDFETLNKEFKNELVNSSKIAESSSNAARVSFMQRTRINAVNEVIRQLLENINEINDKMKSQSDAINRTSVSVQQMMANIVTVSQGSVKASAYSKILDSEARGGGNISESVVDSIQGIKDYSKQITNITQVIHNISEQTNLLAMNAAIEAAHAGDFGRGFTVVADKIRKLAEDTANNSVIISDLIEETIQAIEQTVGLVSQSSESSDKILESSNMLSGIISSISTANEELDIGRKDILNNVSNLNSITEAVQELSIKQMQMSSMVSQNISGVDKLAEDVVTVVNDTENDVKVLLGSIENVSQLSNNTVSSMEDMDKKIKELQYIFLQLYKLVISFKTEKTEEEIKAEIKRLSLADKIRIKLENRAKKHRIKENKKKEKINQL